MAAPRNFLVMCTRMYSDQHGDLCNFTQTARGKISELASLEIALKMNNAQRNSRNPP